MSMPVISERAYTNTAMVAFGSTVILGAIAVIGSYVNFSPAALHGCLGGLIGTAVITTIAQGKAFSLENQRMELDNHKRTPSKAPTFKENFDVIQETIEKKGKLAFVTYDIDDQQAIKFIRLTSAQVRMAEEEPSAICTDQEQVAEKVQEYLIQNKAQVESQGLFDFGIACADYSEGMGSAYRNFEVSLSERR